MRLRVATRASALARWQAERVATRLGYPYELVTVSTTGDERTTTPIHEMGGQGVFVKEVQDAVLGSRADLAIHSAKDLPPVTARGLHLVAIPERADARDALVGAALDDIPIGGRVGTDSVRRRAQLAALRGDLVFGSLRGNISTRLDKARDFEAIVVALAALERLDLTDRVAQVLEPDQVLPQVGQGALAVECRADDGETAAIAARLDDLTCRRPVTAERAFLEALGGGCDMPCGALARLEGETIRVEALLASPDGGVTIRATARHADPRTAGTEVARVILDERGGRALLEER
jgi:hydroxymethylbilane synthase